MTNDRTMAENAAKRLVNVVIESDTSLIYAEKREYRSKMNNKGIMVFCKVYGHYNITK